jgi:peptidyl-tRNA hydrolase
MAQAAHAATAVTHLHRENDAVKDYLADWKHMRKVGG